MAYHAISIMDIWDIIRRWHERHSIRQIAQATGYDRKTIRNHIRFVVARLGLSLNAPLPSREVVLCRIQQESSHSSGRQPQAQNILAPYRDEIASLINDSDLAVKPKTAFGIILERHDLVGKVSYPSFKRFVRAHKLALSAQRTSCRLEAPPGGEVQVDYARICLMFDPVTERRRTLWAFIATLAHSRMKYIELTFRQDQTSFAAAHIRMFEFFGGVPQRVILDNLKAGVIKPDLYTPSLNRTYGEMCEHYGCFVDPARVRHPKDKGKVERDVQTVREAVRAQIVQSPDATLVELNRLMKHWSVEVYGQREHGTTHEKPFVILLERERPTFQPLPSAPFELAEWKQATVHPDHYIQFRTKAYSVPHAYVGKTVWIRATERIVQVFCQERLIKQHVITSRYRHTDYADFPENVRAALDTSTIHRTLLEKARLVGPCFHRIIDDLFAVHAFVNLRSAQGLVSFAERFPAVVVEQAAHYMDEHGIKSSLRNFRLLLDRLQAQAQTPALLPLSPDTNEFIRDITYFINTTPERPS